MWKRMDPSDEIQHSGMKTVSTLETEFHQALTQLVGLPLAATRRAADMLVLHFGTMRIASKVDLP